MVRNLDENNLTQLQNLLRKDPGLYKEEFEKRLRHLDSLIELYKSTEADFKSVDESIKFLSSTVSCYPKHVDSFSEKMIEMLKQSCLSNNTDLLKSIIHSLLLINNKSKENNKFSIIPSLFEVFNNQNKELKKLVSTHIISHTKNINLKSKNNKYNRKFQDYINKTIFQTDLKDGKKETLVLNCIQILSALYRKNVWNDENTIRILSRSCFLENSKVASAAVLFFLNEEQESEEEKEQAIDIGKLKHKLKVNGRSCSKNKLEKAKKKSNKEVQSVSYNHTDHSIYNHLDDSQEFAEKLYKRVLKNIDKFDIKIYFLRLISKLISVGKLFVLDYYSYLLKYLKPSQENSTQFLVIMAQAVHELIPPDVIFPVIKHIANNFVCESFFPEVIIVGINAIREICSRCPLAITSELLNDVISYKSIKNKSIIMAARSLLNLYREVNPGLLQSSHKSSRPPTEQKNIAYGQQCTHKAEDIENTFENEVGEEEDEEEEEDDDEEEEEERSEKEREGLISERKKQKSDPKQPNKRKTKDDSSDNSDSDDPNEDTLNENKLTKFIKVVEDTSHIKEKYKHRFSKKEDKHSLTNKEKMKLKPYKMHSYKSKYTKTKLSLHEKQKKESLSRKKKHKGH